MPTENGSKSPQDFRQKRDAGEFDGGLASKIKKLTHEQLEEVIRIMMDRYAWSHRTSARKQI